MSRKRLIASLTVISCCLALVLALAARTFPLKAAVRSAGYALKGTAQQNLDRVAPLVDRIEIKHHDFGSSVLNDVVLSQERARLDQLPDRLIVETAYDQEKVDAMRKVLEDFWSERGSTIEVHFTLLPSPRSPRNVILQLDVYKQTVLAGKLEGGIAGSIAGGLAQGISRGVAGGITKGIVEGISGGITGGISTRASADEPSVDISTIWTGTVKKGAMPLQVRGSGKLVPGDGFGNLVAKVAIPALMAADVHPNQEAVIMQWSLLRDTHRDLVKGHVINLDASSPDETRTVNIALDAPLPPLLRATLEAGKAVEVDANITIGKLDNVLYIGRPANVPANSAPNVSASLFKIDADGKGAERVIVKIGRPSANTIEVVAGLKEGDKVIISDMSAVDNADRIRLTDEKHLINH